MRDYQWRVGITNRYPTANRRDGTDGVFGGGNSIKNMA